MTVEPRFLQQAQTFASNRKNPKPNRLAARSSRNRLAARWNGDSYSFLQPQSREALERSTTETEQAVPQREKQLHPAAASFQAVKSLLFFPFESTVTSFDDQGDHCGWVQRAAGSCNGDYEAPRPYQLAGESAVASV